MTIALIHTSPSMVPVFKSITDELIHGHTIFNMVDESLLCDIIREKGCPPATARRLVGHVLSAEDAGADVIMVTCSSMGRAVEAARAVAKAKVLRVDEPMADQAVEAGARIGVAATLPSTLDPTVELIRRKADAAGKAVEVIPTLIDGAFAAVISGDGSTHDRLVADSLKTLMTRADVIVLAQASMARVVPSLGTTTIPILSSPRAGVERLATLLRT